MAQFSPDYSVKSSIAQNPELAHRYIDTYTKIVQHAYTAARYQEYLQTGDKLMEYVES